MRKILSGVLRVGRATALALGVAVMVGLTSSALGATNGNFILGKRNVAETASSLVTTMADARKAA